ncbi:MAG: hydrogen gas-evolving membrane-bound hydrogenase subunit E [Anaerolineae bacterium]|jgi:multicomponent Na+:H+ antiporter subunit A
MTLVAIVLIPFLAAIVAALVAPRAGRAGAWLLASIPAGLAVWLMALAPAALAGAGVELAVPWVPQLGVYFALRLDGLSLLFALLISGIGALVVLYSGYYLNDRARIGRFQAYIFLFMGSMLGVVLANDLITLFVFWELTSVTSYLLIGFDHENERARYGALKALLITAGGGLAMLLGLVLMGMAGGTLRIDELLSMGPALQASPTFLPMLLLILVGAFTKSAQFPFHIWLPDAMRAPSPVSAYLHSATMVKAGIYLLARLHPALGGTPAWEGIVSAVGLFTMVLGAYLAFKQTDLKALLAYSTISTLGLIVSVIGLGTPDALMAAMVMILAHALYKAALFLVVGTVDHETGTRDWRRLGGLARVMPITAAAAFVASLSLAGLPPMLGFIAKELFLEAETHVEAGSALALLGPLLGIVAAAFGMAYSILLVRDVFFGPRQETPKHPHEAPIGMLVGPVLLALLSIALAWPPLLDVVDTLLYAAASASLGQPLGDLHLAFWHGVNLPLILSSVAIAAGVILYWQRRRFWALQQRVPAGLTLNRVYDGALVGLNRLAVGVTGAIQTGTLRHYLMMILGTLGVSVLWALLAGDGLQWQLNLDLSQVAAYEVAAAILMIVAAVAVVLMPSRLGAIVALGTVGSLVAFFFVIYSGPDLALTQLLVETLTVIILLLVFFFLPNFFEDRSTALHRWRDLGIAIGVGALVTTLVILVVPINLSPTISSYYVENSLTKAYGANVVNVILVDFRGFDTLGEITVLTIAALGITGMLKLRLKPGSRHQPVQDDDRSEAER